jgi:hypothetical protein
MTIQKAIQSTGASDPLLIVSVNRAIGLNENCFKSLDRIKLHSHTSGYCVGVTRGSLQKKQHKQPLTDVTSARTDSRRQRPNKGYEYLDIRVNP